MKTAILAALALVCVTLNAEARPRKAISYVAAQSCNVDTSANGMRCEGVGPTARGLQFERAVPFGKAVQRYQPEVSSFGAPTPNFAYSVGAPYRFIRGRLICAVNVNSALAERGIRGTGSAAARSFLSWGRPSGPEPGAVAVFSRRGGGHVAIVAGRDAQGRVLYLNPSARRQAWQVGPYHRRPIAFRVAS